MRFADGTLAKFWGVNFNGGANFPEHDYAHKVARRLSMAGVNMVRFHQMMEIGQAPILAEVLEADIRLKTVHGDKLKVWGVNAEGFYAGKLATTYEDGWLCFHIGDVQNPACYYLIVKE